MSERALSFGADALAYHRHRPGYPDAIVDVVLGHAVGPVTRALEIGAGTGKATVLFASRGIRVLAVEPDEAMRAVLDDQTQGMPVSSIGATYENLDLSAVGKVDLLFAAAAFHWTDPSTRWDRAASVLRSGGVAAFFGAFTELVDPADAAHVEGLEATAWERTTFDLGSGNDGGSAAWPASDLRRRPEFCEVMETSTPRRTTMTSRDYAAHLSTVSAYRALPRERRHDLLTQILNGLPGTVEVSQDVVLHLARRR